MIGRPKSSITCTHTPTSTLLLSVFSEPRTSGRMGGCDASLIRDVPSKISILQEADMQRVVISVALVGICVATGDANAKDLKDEGVGTYSDASVAFQISNFTINRQMVSCGVGTFSDPPGTSGEFAMLMYATNIFRYHANHQAKIITASGRMRSITHVSSTEVEDAEHDFLVIAEDNGATGDRFDVHFTTPFWNPTNPFCTPSTEVAGWCRFGGVLVTDASGVQQMGEISVGP